MLHILSVLIALSIMSGCVGGGNPVITPLKVSSTNHSIHVAAHYGKVEEVKRLIKSGVDVDLKNGDGQTPLSLASTSLSNLKFHIHVDSLNPYGVYEGTTVSKLVETIKFLVESGADVNYRYSSGLYILNYAEDELFHTLLTAGATKIQTNKVNDDNYSPLHVAAMYGLSKVAEYLVSKGAYLEDRNNMGMTPLQFAIVLKQRNVVDVLEKYNNNKVATTRNGILAEVHARGREEVVTSLQNADLTKIKFNSSNSSMTTHFGVAPTVMAGVDQQINQKLEKETKGMNQVNLLANNQRNIGLDNQKEFPLANETEFMKFKLAIQDSKLILIKDYIENKKLNINVRSVFGDTPLHIAVYYRKKDIVEYLIDKGANPYLKNGSGELPIDIAKQEKTLFLDKTTSRLILSMLVRAMKNPIWDRD
jgi:ankyrin repeat protein